MPRLDDFLTPNPPTLFAQAGGFFSGCEGALGGADVVVADAPGFLNMPPEEEEGADVRTSVTL